MKRAKIMLTAIAVFAVVGGAMAVKVTKTPVRWCKNSSPGHPICSIPIDLSLTSAVGNAGFDAFLSTTVAGGACVNGQCSDIRVTPVL